VLNNGPNLIIITSEASPHLNLVSIGCSTISEIEAFIFIEPDNLVCAGDLPFLVAVVRGARPDLHLRAIRVDAVCDVQAFVAEHLDCRSDETP